jgi:hypothetical protein
VVLTVSNTEKNNIYNSGKIYTIRSDSTDKYYIGSTTQPLSKRLYDHKNDFKRYNEGKYCYISSFEIVKFDDCYIELLENYCCNTREELHKREGELIREFKNEIINKCIPKRTDAEYRKENADKIKQYYKDNADKIKQLTKQYREANTDKIKQYKKDNADKIKQYKKQYREVNKEKLKQYQIQYKKAKKLQKQTNAGEVKPEKTELELLEEEFNNI